MSVLQEVELSVSTAADVVESLLYLLQCRRDDDSAAFASALEALGMSANEAQSYWEFLDSPSELLWNEAKDNTEITQRFGLAISSRPSTPRNWLLYRVVSLALPDILQCELVGTRHMGGEESADNPADRLRIIFDRFPTDASSTKGQLLSIWRFLQGAAATQFSQAVVRAAGSLREELGADLGLRFAELLVEQKMLIPQPRMVALVSRVLKAGLDGQQVTLAGAFCPDYAYERTENPDLPYRYTFDGLGDGVGLVAQQFTRILPALSAFLTDLGVEHQVVLGIGDFEADNQDILDQVGVDRTEFFARCRRSLEAFRQAVPETVPLQLEMCWEDRAGDRLRPYSDAAFERMMAGDFGEMRTVFPDLDAIIERIPGQYKTFYERWFGRDMADREVLEVILKQAGEYAALAQITIEDLGRDVIMLAGDRPEMNRFNCFPEPLATLCAKRAY